MVETTDKEKELYQNICLKKSKDYIGYMNIARELSSYYYHEELKEELASLEIRVQEILLRYVRTYVGEKCNVLNEYEMIFGVRDYY